MNKNLIILCSILGLVVSFVSFPEGAMAVLLVTALSIPTIYLLRRYSDNDPFPTNIFLIALFIRISFGVIIYVFDIKSLIAEDTGTYNDIGQGLVEIWQGLPVSNDRLTLRLTNKDPGWGMYYLVGSIYFIFGQSILVAQSFCAVVGAATAPMLYFCAEKIFHNQRVAKTSAIAVAVFPSFVVWSSQMLKDGLVIFLLVFTMTMVLQLQKKFNYPAVILLVLALFGILSLRFYIFYMVAIAVVGSFVIGFSSSLQSMIRNTIVVVLVGLALTYLGVIRNTTTDFERYGSLERVQISRQDLSRANSGFGEDIDVSTTEGAITAIPIGFVYLMFAPFPWDVGSFRQAITLPEVLLWWALMPFLITGFWYTLKNHLRSSISILLFSSMLTLAYSIFQGNVGTAYRQRTQIQVFLFIFIAVGWTLIQENKENRKAMRQQRKQQINKQIRANT